MKAHQATTERLETLVKGQMVVAANTPQLTPQIVALEELVDELKAVRIDRNSVDSQIVKLEGLVGKLDAHEQTSEALVGLVGKLQNQAPALAVDSDGLESQITSLEHLVGKLDALDARTAPASCSSHEVAFSELDSKITSLAAFESSIRQTIKETSEQQERLQGTIAQLEQQQQKPSHEPLDELKTIFTSELSKVTNTISSLNSEVDNLRSTTNEIATKVSDVSKAKDLNNLKESSQTMRPNTMAARRHTHISHELNPYDSLMLDAISKEDVDNLKNHFMEHGKFETARGRKVALYGSEYNYPGSKGIKAQPTPEILQPIIERINKLEKDAYAKRFPDAVKFNRPSPHITACLVNMYEGEESFIPEHQDDEDSIHPESTIFTLSLGSPCEVVFKDRETGRETELSCPDRSIYSMSRRSQDFFTHRMDKGSLSTEQGVRLSLTFRSVGWQNSNATCLIGDSNSGHLAFGDSKHGTFGASMPGQRFFAPYVHDIDPKLCIAYKNVVLMCGTNNIRRTAVRREEDVRGILDELSTKVKQIQELNPKCCIYICPILPTKDLHINQKVFHYDSILKNEFIPEFSGVRYVSGFERFLDHQQLLSRDLSRPVDRYGRPDILHLNAQGTRTVASLIKQCIFQREGRKDRGPQSRSQSVREPPASGRPHTQPPQATGDGYQVP